MQIRKVFFSFDLLLACFSLVMLWFTIMLQVVLRQVFSAPLTGAEEMTMYLVACLVITPLGFTEQVNGHIIMEELQAVFPSVIKKIVRFIVSVTTTAVYILITVSVFNVIHNNMHNTTPMLRMPFWLFFLPSAIGFCWLSIIRIIKHFCFLFNKELPWVSQ